MTEARRAALEALLDALESARSTALAAGISARDVAYAMQRYAQRRDTVGGKVDQ